MTHRRTFTTALLLATSLMTLPFGLSSTSRAHPDPTTPYVANASFNLIGHIEKFKLDTISDIFSPATITVRGIDVLLPANIQIVMPGQYQTPQQLFDGQSVWQDGTGNAGSGLALADTWVGPAADAPSSRIPFEAEIIGNIVGGRYIAGVIHISQGGLHAGAGFVQAIDTSTGELRVGVRLTDVPGGTPNGARVVLNDPGGIYGPANSALPKLFMKLDGRFALDNGNSPVHARTGYPVCVTDSADPAKCPAINRPSDTTSLRFTCGTTATANTIPPLASCDPTRPAPLRVGDYITYMGMLTEGPESDGSANKVYRIAAHAIEAELGIYTAPGADPAYVFIEEALQGTLGERFVDPTAPTAVPPALIPSEETTRFRIVGFTSDPTRQIEVAIFDAGVAGTEGAGTPPLHPGGIAILSPPAGLPTITGGQYGRFRGTWPSKDDARAVRHEVRARIIGGARTQGAGWTASEYVAPIGEYIYPEPTAYGNPGYMLPVPFESFCFLGTLSPFPASGHPFSQEIGRKRPQGEPQPPHVCGELEPP